jgi:hypothetical protein
MQMISRQQSGIQTREHQGQPTKKDALQRFNLFLWMTIGLINSNVFLYLTSEFNIS